MPLSITTVELEVNSRCNLRCSYCPVSLIPKPDAPRFMSDAVFERIIGELARHDYRGRLSYHFYNEPLLRADLERLVAIAARELPRAHQVLFTNGELLTDERYGSLRAAGVAFIVITSHTGATHPERPFQIVQTPPELELTNRGGLMRQLPAATAEHRALACFAPDEMLIVTAAGDVLLCYEDARREHRFGNVMERPLDELWLAPAFVEVRRRLQRGEREAASAICAQCTNRAHVEPGRSSHSEPFWDHVAHDW